MTAVREKNDFQTPLPAIEKTLLPKIDHFIQMLYKVPNWSSLIESKGDLKHRSLRLIDSMTDLFPLLTSKNFLTFFGYKNSIDHLRTSCTHTCQTTLSFFLPKEKAELLAFLTNCFNEALVLQLDEKIIKISLQNFYFSKLLPYMKEDFSQEALQKVKADHLKRLFQPFVNSLKESMHSIHHQFPLMDKEEALDFALSTTTYDFNTEILDQLKNEIKSPKTLTCGHIYSVFIRYNVQNISLHAFVIEELPRGHEPESLFRIYQSSIREYTLADYIHREYGLDGAGCLTQHQIDQFLNDLQLILCPSVNRNSENVRLAAERCFRNQTTVPPLLNYEKNGKTLEGLSLRYISQSYDPKNLLDNSKRLLEAYVSDFDENLSVPKLIASKLCEINRTVSNSYIKNYFKLLFQLFELLQQDLDKSILEQELTNAFVSSSDYALYKEIPVKNHLKVPDFETIYRTSQQLYASHTLDFWTVYNHVNKLYQRVRPSFVYPPLTRQFSSSIGEDR